MLLAETSAIPRKQVARKSVLCYNQKDKSGLKVIHFMKKFLSIACTLALIVSLTGCDTKFDGSRTGNDSEFIMEYSLLNQTDTQDLIAKSGDTISGKMIINKGSLSIKIQKDEEKPIYESNGISESTEFDVEIDESGTYTVSVTGEKAKGSVSFQVVANQ